MNGNNSNNPFNNDMPKPVNSNDMPKPANSNDEKKPIIEIPQAYYDRLAAEQKEKYFTEQEEKIKIQEKTKNKKIINKLILLILVNAILIFGFLYSMINFNSIIIIAIPIYLVIFAIYGALKNKNNSDQPLASLIGGMLVAVITFVISVIKEDEVDLWTYYAIASAIVGFLGFLISNIITKIFTDRKNIKALSTIGIVLFFAALIGVPFYLYKKFPEEFYKIVFLKQTEVHAETEEEFIIKTLRNRYNVEFTCDKSTVKHQIDQYSQKITQRECKDPNNRVTIVKSTTYNESENQFVITEDYIDQLYLKDLKENILKAIENSTSITDARIYLYPEKNCTFIGDCVKCDEYFESYEEENNFDNQFKNSTQLNLSKYLNKNAIEFVNEFKFKYIITILGTYNETTDFNAILNNLLSNLNNMGLKNTYGYNITISSYDESRLYEEELFEAKGQRTDDLTFKDPEIIEK